MKMYFKISMVVVSLVFLITSVNAGYEDFEDLEFKDVVHAFRKRKAITVSGNEYFVLKEHPKLSSPLYKGEKVSTNPCYPLSCGLGPKLLRLEDIENLPGEADFFFHSFDKDSKNKYITIRFTSNNNPDWALMHTFPEPFKEPEHRYWQDEHNKDCVQIGRTVNLLLKRVS